jgi:NAD-dependent deacetylase
MCKCGGIIKPDVVLYEEPLPTDMIMNANKIIHEADTLIVLGTSLMVYPAAGYVDMFRGDNLVIINMDSTPYDDMADVVIHDSLSDVISKL